MDTFELFKRIVIREIEEMQGICMEFKFKISKASHEPNCLIFAKKDKIIELNFETE